MKMTSKCWVVATVGVILAGQAFGEFTYDDFEGYANGEAVDGSHQWNAYDTVVATNEKSHWGLQAVLLPPSENLSNNVAQASVSGTNRVWTDFFALPRYFVSEVATGPVAQVNATAQFYIASNGYWNVIYGVGGAVTQQVGQFLGDQESNTNWVHVSVLHNYSTKKWSLYLEDELIAANMTFINTAVTRYGWFNIANGGVTNTWVDDVTISNRVPATLTADRDHDGMADAWEFMYFGGLDVAAPTGDPDGDGYNNMEESSLRTDPLPPDGFNDPGAARVTSSLPFYEYFDARQADRSIYKQNGWVTTAPIRNLMVQTNVTFMGTKALRMGSGTASHTFTPSGFSTSLWTHLVVKPIPHDGTQGTLMQSEEVAFRVAADGTVEAYDTDGWVTLANILDGTGNPESPFAVDTNIWTRFITKVDYTTRKWSLYAQNVSGGSVTSTYARLLAADMSFNAGAVPQSSYQMIVVTNLPAPGTTGYLDNIEITMDMSRYIDTDGNGVPDYFELANGMDPTNPLDDNKLAFAWGGTSNNYRMLGLDLVANTKNMNLRFRVGKDRTYSVVGSANPTGPFTNRVGLFYTGYDGQQNTHIQTNALNLGIRYFYNLITTSPDGTQSATDRTVYVWYQQSRTNSDYYWVGVPVDYEQGSNNLNSALGSQLGLGLYPNEEYEPALADIATVSTTNGTKLVYYYYAGQWLDNQTYEQANFTNQPGYGILLARKTYGLSTNAVAFSGLARTTTVEAITLLPGWNLRTWPYDTVTNQLGWGLSSTNCSANNSASLSDSIYIDNRAGTHPGRTEKFIQMRLFGNNVWRFVPDTSTDPYSIQLKPNEAIYIQHRSATPSTWAPARPPQ